DEQQDTNTRSMVDEQDTNTCAMSNEQQSISACANDGDAASNDGDAASNDGDAASNDGDAASENNDFEQQSGLQADHTAQSTVSFSSDPCGPESNAASENGE